MSHCNLCSFSDIREQILKGHGATDCIVLLSDYPVEAGDTKVAQILKAACHDLGIEDEVYHSMTCRCQSQREPTIAEIRCCRDNHLLPEMKMVNPKLIIAMGNIPGKAMSDNNNFRVTNERGSKSLWHGIPVMYTYHPSAILYDRTKLDYWEKDMQGAVRWYRSGCQTETSIGYVIRPWDKLTELPLFPTSNVVAVDVETNSLDPYGGGRIVSISAAPDGRHVYYTEVRDRSISELLEPLRGFSVIVCHNATFDMAWLTKDCHYSHWIWHLPRWEDTMLAMQFKDERYPNLSLSHLAWAFTGTKKIETPSFVKEGFPQGWDTPDNRKLLKLYNCRDSIATIRLYNTLLPDIENLRCYQWVSENLKLAVRMRHSGIRISSKKLLVLEDETKKHIDKLEPNLKKSGVNLNSTDSIKRYIYGKLKLPVIARTKKTRQPQLTKKVLDTLVPMDKTGWVAMFKEYKSYLKLHNDYIPRFRKAGKFSHPRVFITQTDDGHGADTGRVTCEGFVNLPREGGVKHCVVSRYGKKGLIVAADGSQMEMRVLANESKDPVLVEAFNKGLDLHSYTASQVFKVPIEEVTKDQRQKAKTVNFGVVYGQTAKGLAFTSGMTYKESVEFLNQYFTTLKGTQIWLHYMKNKAMTDKKVYSPTGRPFHLSNAFNMDSKDTRKATNSPIQEAANAFNVEAAKQLQAYFDRKRIKGNVILMVYDSIVVDVLKKDWERMPEDWAKTILVDKVKEVMRKRLDWNIFVPVVYDVAYGPSYGEAK